MEPAERRRAPHLAAELLGYGDHLRHRAATNRRGRPGGIDDEPGPAGAGHGLCHVHFVPRRLLGPDRRSARVDDVRDRSVELRGADEVLLANARRWGGSTRP